MQPFSSYVNAEFYCICQRFFVGIIVLDNNDASAIYSTVTESRPPPWHVFAMIPIYLLRRLKFIRFIRHVDGEQI